MEEKRTFKETVNDLKQRTKEKIELTCDWCKRHKETLVVLIPVVVSGTVELVKVVAKSKNQKEERVLKENFIYDRQHGHYYELKRAPKSSEWRMIDMRKGEGESLGDILADMRILK